MRVFSTSQTKRMCTLPRGEFPTVATTVEKPQTFAVNRFGWFSSFLHVWTNVGVNIATRVFYTPLTVHVAHAAVRTPDSAVTTANDSTVSPGKRRQWSRALVDTDSTKKHHVNPVETDNRANARHDNSVITTDNVRRADTIESIIHIISIADTVSGPLHARAVFA